MSQSYIDTLDPEALSDEAPTMPMASPEPVPYEPFKILPDSDCRDRLPDFSDEPTASGTAFDSDLIDDG